MKVQELLCTKRLCHNVGNLIFSGNMFTSYVTIILAIADVSIFCVNVFRAVIDMSRFDKIQGFLIVNQNLSGMYQWHVKQHK